MNSFDKLMEIYPSAYTDAERAQTFLWYHLRKFPKKKAAHLKTIRRYFRRADRRVPSLDELRSAFTQDKGSMRRFPPGTSADTFGFAPEDRHWHDEKFGKCFDHSSLMERAEISLSEKKSNHPFLFWFGVVASTCSIASIPLSIFLWVIGKA